MSDYSQDEITLYNNYLSSYKHKEIFSSSDIYVVPIFLLLIFLFLRYKKTKQPLEIQHFFLLGYYFRIIGLILFVVFHKYLYSGGVDSFSYYWSGNNIYHFAKIDFIKAIKFIFYPNGTFNEYDFPVTLNPFVYTENESLITKVSALGNMFL
jgi:hypothetical protein